METTERIIKLFSDTSMSQNILRYVSVTIQLLLMLLYENNLHQLNCQVFSNSKIDGVLHGNITQGITSLFLSVKIILYT